MANAFDPDESGPPDAGGGPPGGAPPGGGGPPGMPPGGPPGPPGGGGPILASIARQQMGPPVTAPGPGNQASGMNLLTQAHGLMAQALQMFPGGSPQSKDILDSMKRLGRHMAQEAPSAGVQQTGLMDLIRNVAKNALLQRIMAQSGGGRGPGGPPGGRPGGGRGGRMAGGAPGGPGGAPGGAPGPSMPLPGA